MMPDSNNLHDWAIWYAAHDFAVFPIKPKDKAPATAHGYKNATKAPAQIEYWWRKCPDYNIGIATGAPSGGLVVIDLDNKPDKGINGYHTLLEWQKKTGTTLPDTARAITGSGGYHLLYKDADNVHCSTDPETGIDIRADGGYIVAPPSVHPNGRRYEWEVAPEDEL